MSPIRRLVHLCLALAFAGYGMVVGSAAHAHSPDDGRNHLLHAVVLDVAQHVVDDVSHDHHHDDVDTGHHHYEGTDGSGSGHSGFHVHSVPVFDVGGEPEMIAAPIMVKSAMPIERSSVHPSGLFSPLKKPPRAFP